MASIAIVGKSSTGKSHSIQYLDPKTTYVIQMTKKNLPWRSSASQYSEENKNKFYTSKLSQVSKVIKAIIDNKPEIDTIVLDDFGHGFVNELMARINETGYDKYKDVAKYFYNIKEVIDNANRDIMVFYLWHEDSTIYETGKVVNGIKTLGQIMKKWFEPEEFYDVILYSTIYEDEKEGIVRKFVTNNDKTYPAKSPVGMFDEIYVDNNLLNIKKIYSEYYS